MYECVGGAPDVLGVPRCRDKVQFVSRRCVFVWRELELGFVLSQFQAVDLLDLCPERRSKIEVVPVVGRCSLGVVLLAEAFADA